MQTTIRGSMVSIRRQGTIEFELDRFHFDEATRPADFRRQARRTAEDGIAGVIFMPSRHADEAARQEETFLRACREVGLAVVLIERNLRGRDRPLKYDLIAADDVDGGLQCTRHLLEQGRRRIAFLMGSPTSSQEGRLAGYLAALYRTGGGSPPRVLQQPDRGEPRGMNTETRHRAGLSFPGSSTKTRASATQMAARSGSLCLHRHDDITA